ncbi:hypothetical protein ACS0TY_008318 [Phlomoides rotata]
MEEKRKRATEASGKTAKVREDDGVKTVAPPDEEVEEFFAILRRIQIALKYFQKRDSGRELTSAPWSPSFEREDFESVERRPEGKQGTGLDLNSDPAFDDRDVSDYVNNYS